MAHSAGDVFGKIGFGVELNCLENSMNREKGNESIDAFLVSTAVIFLRFTQPVWLWRLERYLNIGFEGKNKEYIKVISMFIHRVISESVARKNNEAARPRDNVIQPPKDLISLFFNSKVKPAKN